MNVVGGLLVVGRWLLCVAFWLVCDDWELLWIGCCLSSVVPCCVLFAAWVLLNVVCCVRLGFLLLVDWLLLFVVCGVLFVVRCLLSFFDVGWLNVLRAVGCVLFVRYCAPFAFCWLLVNGWLLLVVVILDNAYTWSIQPLWTSSTIV